MGSGKVFLHLPQDLAAGGQDAYCGEVRKIMSARLATAPTRCSTVIQQISRRFARKLI